MATGFNPKRLELARQRRGLTIVGLAKLLGLDKRTVSGYERGEHVPSDVVVGKMSLALRFPTAFFTAWDDRPGSDDPYDALLSSASFRSVSRLKSGERNSALGAGRIGIWLARFLDAFFELPAPDIPNLRGVEPSAAARVVREAWGLGERPISNMVHLLESKGVRVFSLAEDTLAMDAFCLWDGSEPFMFLNTAKSAEHSRFDAAHELAHLCLHRHEKPTGRDAEIEANRFASAFLMPEADVRATPMWLPPSLTDLVAMKKRWNVSAAALAYRLNSLGLVGEWHYKHLCIEMTKRGYRSSEPEPSPREVSQVLPKMFELLEQDGVTRAVVAEHLQVYPSEIDALCFGLRVLHGGGAKSGGGRPTLRLV